MDFFKNKLNIIIAIICMILFGVLYLNRPGRQELIPLDTPPAAAGPEASGPETHGLESVLPAESEAPLIKVHVTGAVANPGVYELPTGSRAADALEAAGGEGPEADLEALNLAKILRDEEQVKIPRLGEAVDKTDATIQNETDADSGLININTAGTGELTRLPGIGQVIAENIIAYREERGGFKSVDELKNVNRIGGKTFDRIKDLITIN